MEETKTDQIQQIDSSSKIDESVQIDSKAKTDQTPIIDQSSKTDEPTQIDSSIKTDQTQAINPQAKTDEAIKDDSILKTNNPPETNKIPKIDLSIQRTEPLPPVFTPVKKLGRTKQKSQYQLDLEDKIPKPQSAYYIFLMEKRQPYKDAHPDMTMCQVQKILNTVWKKFADADRRPYEERSQKTKQVYDEEVKKLDWNCQSDGKGGKNKRMHPKKPMSGYFQFIMLKRVTLRHYKCPELGMVQQSKVFVDEWRAMTPEKKQYYLDCSTTDRIRYDKQMEEFEKDGKWTELPELKWEDLQYNILDWTPYNEFRKKNNIEMQKEINEEDVRRLKEQIERQDKEEEARKKEEDELAEQNQDQIVLKQNESGINDQQMENQEQKNDEKLQEIMQTDNVIKDPAQNSLIDNVDQQAQISKKNDMDQQMQSPEQIGEAIIDQPMQSPEKFEDAKTDPPIPDSISQPSEELKAQTQSQPQPTSQEPQKSILEPSENFEQPQ